jgi:hypothetical protein
MTLIRARNGLPGPAQLQSRQRARPSAALPPTDADGLQADNWLTRSVGGL